MREPVLIEHVNPLRARAREVADLIATVDATDIEVAKYIKRKYRLMLLTPEETSKLNRRNRSRMEPNRLDGILLAGKVAIVRNVARIDASGRKNQVRGGHDLVTISP